MRCAGGGRVLVDTPCDVSTVDGSNRGLKMVDVTMVINSHDNYNYLQ